MTSRRAAAGFTLLELLVVLAMVSVVSVAAVQLAPRLSPALEARNAARELAAALRHARSEAMIRFREVRLLVDLDTASFHVEGTARQHALPTGMEVSLQTAETERLDERLGGIRFFPDGSSTGGRLRLETAGAAYDVTVDWFTGDVSIVD